MNELKEKVVLHPLFLLLALTAVWTGHFLFFICIMLLVVIHECGHVAMALLFRWKIESVELWFFGATMVSEDYYFRPWYERLLVTIAGPVQHLWLGALLPHLGLTPAWEEVLLFYNYWLALFNLLPIWPLDGGRLLWVGLSQFLSFWWSFRIAIILSFFAIVVCLLVFPFYYSMFLFFVFIGKELREQWKHHYYLHIRFLLHCLRRNLHRTRIVKVTPDEAVSPALKKLNLSGTTDFLEGDVLHREKACIKQYLDHPDSIFLDIEEW